MNEMRKLSEVADLTVGYVGNMGKEYSDEGIVFLRSLNIKPFKIELSEIKHIPQAFHQEIKKSELLENFVEIKHDFSILRILN